MIRALIFDFNGVIVDDEPVHFTLFLKVLAEVKVRLSKEDYYAKYLGMDDFGCFAAAAGDQGKKLSEEKIEELTERKNRYYLEVMETTPPFVPGVLEFIQELAATHYLAVVSGALRREVEWLLGRGGVATLFQAVVAAEDVEHGKPDPEGFEMALQLLNRDYVASSEILLPGECLAIEDSAWGIRAAKGAGMPALAVTTSFTEKELSGAVHYLKNFEGVDPEALVKRISEKLEP